MPLEMINTIAAVGTMVVIGATAIAALVQLRHMRNSNQLTGLLEVLSRVEDPVFNEWLDRAKDEAEKMLPDANFRKSVVAGTYPRENNPWLNMMNSYEWVGSLVKHGLIPEEAFLDVYSARILRAWDVVEPFFALVRRRGDTSLLENFEYLVVLSRDWERKYPNGAYPRRAPRLMYQDAWLPADNSG